MNPLETRPNSVAIVALGPSNHDYVNATCSKKEFLRVDEVWLVNSANNSFRGDKIFVMDNLKRVESRFPIWAASLQRSQTPVITSVAYPDYPSSVAYPLEAVCDHFKDDFMTTTVAYMLAYAIYTNVKDLYLFGCDFWYPGSKAVEPGMDCVSYYLGIAKERKMNFKIPQSSVLLDAHMTKFTAEGKRHRPMYGYDYNPGESQQRVINGQGSELDHAVAMKAPSTLPDMRAKADPNPKSDGSEKAEVPVVQPQAKVENVVHP